MFAKQCRICKENKLLSEFARHPLTADRLTIDCKACGGVGVVDYLTLCLKTPERQFELAAAAIVNDDIESVEWLIGKLEEANVLYPLVLRGMVKLISIALDNLEQK